MRVGSAAAFMWRTIADKQKAGPIVCGLPSIVVGAIMPAAAAAVEKPPAAPPQGR